MQDDLKKIKKYYGENMMHLCRELFPSILEKEGLLFSLLSSKFAYTRFLYQDIINEEREQEFQNYIYSLIKKEENLKESQEDPSTLMKKAGYNLYECHNDFEINFFKKYYAPGEKLCTFNGNRADTHYVFFAVKKNVHSIKRRDYSLPKREDKYGRSVISIQFTKGKTNILSIKNRYNHHVDNPDATYSNNLENIIPGLTDSFAKKYHLNILYNKEGFSLNNYVLAKDGKFYRYNYEINNVYYCSNNIIIDGNNIIQYEKEKYLILDYFILDLMNKKIVSYDSKLSDGLTTNEIYKKIEIINQENGKIVRLFGKNNITLELNKYNQIIKYQSDQKEIGSNFLKYNKTLEEFYDDNLEIVYDNFLTRNNSLKKIEVPNLKSVGDYFLDTTDKIDNISFPNLESVGDLFLRNFQLKEVNIPNLKEIGSCFMQLNSNLEKISLPKVLNIGSYFLYTNRRVNEIYMPTLEKVGHDFMTKNKKLEKIDFPSLLDIDDNFISDNEIIKEVNLPKVLNIGDNFLNYNNGLKKLDLPRVLKIGDCFLSHNTSLEEINLPNVIVIKNNFLWTNSEIKDVILPNVEKVGRDFLANNLYIERLILPKLIECDNDFVSSTIKLKEYDLRCLKKYGYSFLQSFLGECSYKNNSQKILKK